MKHLASAKDNSGIELIPILNRNFLKYFLLEYKLFLGKQNISGQNEEKSGSMKFKEDYWLLLFLFFKEGLTEDQFAFLFFQNIENWPCLLGLQHLTPLESNFQYIYHNHTYFIELWQKKFVSYTEINGKIMVFIW